MWCYRAQGNYVLWGSSQILAISQLGCGFPCCEPSVALFKSKVAGRPYQSSTRAFPRLHSMLQVKLARATVFKDLLRTAMIRVCFVDQLVLVNATVAKPVVFIHHCCICTVLEIVQIIIQELFHGTSLPPLLELSVA